MVLLKKLWICYGLEQFLELTSIVTDAIMSSEFSEKYLSMSG